MKGYGNKCNIWPTVPLTWSIFIRRLIDTFCASVDVSIPEAEGRQEIATVVVARHIVVIDIVHTVGVLLTKEERAEGPRGRYSIVLLLDYEIVVLFFEHYLVFLFFEHYLVFDCCCDIVRNDLGSIFVSSIIRIWRRG